MEKKFDVYDYINVYWRDKFSQFEIDCELDVEDYDTLEDFLLSTFGERREFRSRKRCGIRYYKRFDNYAKYLQRVCRNEKELTDEINKAVKKFKERGYDYLSDSSYEPIIDNNKYHRIAKINDEIRKLEKERNKLLGKARHGYGSFKIIRVNGKAYAAHWTDDKMYPSLWDGYIDVIEDLNHEKGTYYTDCSRYYGCCGNTTKDPEFLQKVMKALED